MRHGRYFINPNFIFNGDRIAFTNVIERKRGRDPNTIDLLDGKTDAEKLLEKKMAETPAPTPRDYKLAENIKQRRDVDPRAQPTAEELKSIDKILVQQARERLLESANQSDE